MSTAVPNHRRTKPGEPTIDPTMDATTLQLWAGPDASVEFAGIKPGAPSNGVAGPTSQIPGLSQSADDSAPAERISGRRVGIFETDSEYVKLAKQGGQKGLLSHDADVEAVPKKLYSPPNWFSADEAKGGSIATSPDGPPRVARQPLAAPFGTDNCSTWDRETDSFGKEKLSPDSAAGELEGLSIAETNKYKRMSYDKKAAPVSMSKLLSFGYMEDEVKTSNDDDDASSMTSEHTSTIATEDVDELE